jgi:type IV secretory pathway TraG/TraD family ATPase VirD4
MLAHMSIAPASTVTYLAKTTHRNSDRLFGIKQSDRRMHMFITGKSGTGKSHLLRLIVEQDISAGRGFALFDPHGDLARAVRDAAVAARPDDVIYIDPRDATNPWRFNPFANVSEENRALAANGIVEVFKKLWRDDWGPRLEHLLRNVAHTLLETPGSTLGDVPPLLTDRSFRLAIEREITNPAVADFWSSEYDKYTPAFQSTVSAPLLNKAGAFLTDPILRRFLTEDGQLLDLRRIMDEGKILVVNLDKGQLGESATALLGSLLLSHIALAGLSRSDIPEDERRDFAVVLDESQLFTTQAIPNMLSELRKYRVSMLLSTQYLGALDPDIRNAVLGNVGSLIAFRAGATDAAQLARELGSPLMPSDLINLPRYHVYVRLLIDGESSRPFSATTISRPE